MAGLAFPCIPMKTIRLIPTVVLAAAPLILAAQAQEFREIPVAPDPQEEPLSMERLFKEAREKEARDAMPRQPDDGRMPETESERAQRMMLDQVRREMMMPEKPEPQMREPKPRWLIGISVVPLEPFIREHLGIEEGSGAKVSMVADNTPAAKAGIVVNDIILTADGRKVATIEEMKEIVEKCGKEGKAVTLEFLHHGNRRSVSLQPWGVEPRPEEARRDNPNPDRRFAELAHRLERQERQIAELQKEVRNLRRQLNEDRDNDKDNE